MSPFKFAFVALSTLALSSAFADSHEATANNSARNEKYRNMNTMTADRQSERTRGDVEITREIRKLIVSDDTFSTSAKNVKIITKADLVTLRGPVANANERTRVAMLAKSATGVANVNNQLLVKKSK